MTRSVPPLAPIAVDLRHEEHAQESHDPEESGNAREGREGRDGGGGRPMDSEAHVQLSGDDRATET